MAQVKIIDRIMKGTLEETLTGKKRVINVYDIAGTGELIKECLDDGYELVQLAEGVLGHGDLVLIAPDESYMNFVIREVALTCWTSGQTIKRCKKLSKAILAEIEKAQAEQERLADETEEQYKNFRAAIETARSGQQG